MGDGDWTIASIRYGLLYHHFSGFCRLTTFTGYPYSFQHLVSCISTKYVFCCCKDTDDLPDVDVVADEVVVGARMRGMTRVRGKERCEAAGAEGRLVRSDALSLVGETRSMGKIRGQSQQHLVDCGAFYFRKIQTEVLKFWKDVRRVVGV